MLKTLYKQFGITFLLFWMIPSTCFSINDATDATSINELEVIRKQLASCWNVPIDATDVKLTKDLSVDVWLEMNPDATVRSAAVVSESKHPHYQVFAESALKVFQNPKCIPLKLPLDRYDQWKTMTIRFDPMELL